MGLTSLLLLIACFAASVQGHGYLMEPPGRASAWRFGFDTPVDYNDNECFCGGFNYQYQVNDGKCGICGDAWDADPREHEVGGLYATGTLVRTYVKGQIIPVTANVTVNHLGHFEYKICANNNVSVEATQECLDMTPLYGAGHEEWFLYIGSTMGVISHELQLPADLECAQCVLQWRYVASNTWGICGNGTEGTGCGPQEEFRGCSDVSILAPPQKREGSADLLPEPAERTVFSAIKVKVTKEQNINVAGEVETEGETVYPASKVEETKEQNSNATGEVETEGETVYPASKVEETKEHNIYATGKVETTGETVYSASTLDETKEQNVNATGEEVETKGENVYSANKVEETNKHKINATGEVETTGETVYSASKGEETKEQNVNATGEEEETEGENENTASGDKETKKERFNTTGKEKETKEEGTEQTFQRPASKLEEMSSSVKVKINEQEEVRTDKRKSKRDEKSEEESDDDASDEDEATMENEEEL